MCITVPVFVVPSIFCISPTGDQLAVYSGAADPKKIVSTLTLGLQVCHNVVVACPVPMLNVFYVTFNAVT